MILLVSYILTGLSHHHAKQEPTLEAEAEVVTGISVTPIRLHPPFSAHLIIFISAVVIIFISSASKRLNEHENPTQDHHF